jgi:tetratricopeptide (TPR) repeat protein
MSKLESIPYLLGQINLKWLDAASIDRDTLARCKEAERLTRQGNYDGALELAAAAVDVATQSGVPGDIGAAFLYLAVIQHHTPRKDAHDQAPEDGKTALEWLKRDRHHTAIAHLIQAQILLDNGQVRTALRHYRRAGELVTALARDWHRRNRLDRENYYVELKREIDGVIKQLPLYRPVASAAGSAPIAGAAAPAPARQPDQFTPPIYEVNRVWINGVEYLVETAKPISPEHPPVRLQADQKYIAIPIEEDDQASNAPARFVLIRENGDTDQPRRFEIAFSPDSSRTWTEEADGAQPYPRIRLLDNAEAFLTPVAAADQSASVAPAIDEELLTCIDTILHAQNARRQPSKELEVIRKQFLSYVQKKYGWEVIPIRPGTTMFDETLGHYAVATVKKSRLKDGVITTVLQHGYKRQKQIVREAHVVVNQLKRK